MTTMAQDHAVRTPGTPVTRDAAGSVRRHELAGFLRHRREHITPEQVGLPRGRRRRTPGLRREEVAHLAAVGVTWYTWLEQARDIQVSVQVLDALARTLFLDPSERAHLFQLAGQVDPTPATSCPSITPAVRAVLEHLEPVPACVQNSRYDILAYNRTYGMLLCDLDAVPPEDRNCMILSYTHDDWCSSIVHLQDAQRMMAARFRATMAGHLAEPAWKMLLKRLRAESAEFCENWDRHEVVAHRTKRKQFDNRHVGRLTVDHTDLWLGPEPGPRIVTYAPADEESRKRLERLQQIALEKGASRDSQPA
ncbi:MULTISPECIES: helix-turn-helix transcriptional regulator [unclassified Streptomyces]|uniref:helix-turn-helix transcriptional regulator n=1 Tax=unclassified Streptomyces TaxID=2593676 RepID=UPI00225646EA|nr:MULTISPECIES: helix-turn-helix transcriptional regulator [unclassified Streptomyces]MCX5048007.1 helix-turn-helix transcriptional regulator [Streptomyces sp. NBC_00474]MCX5057264.1 helix-turn-helix transcriptional regulator [Streptomyces sp. NBC_00452]MCX5245857.1 helix-turn-helix transcriptional regulator [Streptomyces sp. NBC_00201]MCX5288339.1 helix-turn-helix transcriptional regulator [Streptomyces sp. NBC_00183]